jgi:hypothetical protein
MRGTRDSRALGDGESTDLLEALERHRDHHFRRVKARRVAGEKAALGFINEVGFCTAFSAGLGVPCLREAIAGRREPALPEHIQHDYAIGMTWQIKDTLAGRRAAYYGKALGGRPSFIAPGILAAFLRLRVEPGGYLALYRRGMLGHSAKLIMDVLSRRGASETRVLKLSTGHGEPSRRAAFDRAMKELQEKFLALKVEERYDPFTYVWDTMAHRWADALREAKAISRTEAALRIVRRYFETAAFANERALARLLGIDTAMVESAARKLECEGFLARGLRLGRPAGTVAILASCLR